MRSESVTKILSHYRTVHRDETSFRVPCLYPNCSKIFGSESGLRKHLSSFHSAIAPAQKEHFNVQMRNADVGQIYDIEEEHTDEQNHQLNDDIPFAIQPVLEPVQM